MSEVNFSEEAKVSRILTFSCVDGPGNRLVIFLQGCNYNCLNCHNPHTINPCNHCGDCLKVCPSDALIQSPEGKIVWDPALCTQCDRCLEACDHHSNPKITHYTVSQILEIIRDNRFFISGITLSGGEATLQLPFIRALFRAIKIAPELSHLTCFVDSNGSLSVQGWQRLMPELDGAMIDLKAWQEQTHRWLVGRGNHRVFQSIKLLARTQKLHEVRLLYIPGKTDLLQEVEALGSYLRELPERIAIRVNGFRRHGVVGEASHWAECTREQADVFSQRLEAVLGREIIRPSLFS
ncbi:YjjW family glycine radical enzyme activase [Dongshaea marina]|uniref:YjjW family glycine radical enzyme activase n=1 Tax=Dongshaea marina TaxID=2047966 RepID=UPI000D3EB714|nr:YjjW family glycine radical enzyme activase [Dongshaea marina]